MLAKVLALKAEVSLEPTRPAVLLSRSKLTVMEGSTNDFYTIQLKSQPKSRVIVSIREPTNQARAAPSIAEFDDKNWATPQAIRVCALDDTTQEVGAVQKQAELEAMSQMIILEHSIDSADVEYGSPHIQFEFTDKQSLPNSTGEGKKKKKKNRAQRRLSQAARDSAGLITVETLDNDGAHM